MHEVICDMYSISHKAIILSKLDVYLQWFLGGNVDQRRLNKGAKMYYPVEVAGGLLSMGDCHAAQGDGELDGTAIEFAATAKIK